MAKKELSSELRLLLAFGISFLILLVSRPLLVRENPPTPTEAQQNAPAETAATPSPSSTAGTPSEEPGQEVLASPNPLLPVAPVAGRQEEEITVTSDLYQVVFSSRGAKVKSWTLADYQDAEGNPLEVVNLEAAERYGDPLSLYLPDPAIQEEVNNALYVPSRRGRLRAPVTLNFQYSSGGIAVRKQFVFSSDSYVVSVETDLTSNGERFSHSLAWPGSFGDIHETGGRGGQRQVFYLEAGEMTRVPPQDVEGEQTTVSGFFPFAGIEDHFFAAAFLPEEGSLRVHSFKTEITLPGQESATSAVGVAVENGDTQRNRFQLFVGPKSQEILVAVDQRLGELIYFGWFPFIAKPLFYALRWIHDHIIGNYGWAIILLTLVINTLLFPLKITSLRSSRKMQQLAPQLKAIQEKYKHLKMKDPKRQQMSQETMALYKKHGVNPIGGCLPMVLQIPFFIGFYNVLMVAIEMRQAPWIEFWVPDLSRPEEFPIRFLPLLMCASQFLLQKMSPSPSPDPTQQKIMMFMPVMFLFIFWGFSSGLVLYWLTSNATGIAQQWFINQKELKKTIEAKKVVKEKKKRRGGS